MQDDSLKQLERKAWRANFQDGLQEIGLGLMILAFAMAFYFEGVGILFPWNILLFLTPALLIPTVGKFFITRPRIGLVKYGPTRQSIQKKLLVVFIFSTLVLIILVIMTHIGVFPGESVSNLPGISFMGIVGLAVVVFMGFIAYMLDFPRLFFIGIVIGSSVIVHEALYIYTGLSRTPANLISYGTAGGIILVTGVVLLLQFLRKYPLPKMEANDA